MSGLVCDTSGLLAYFDADEADHAAVTAAIEAEPGPFVVSPLVLAELDHFLGTRLGLARELATIDELAGPAWELAAFATADLRAARAVVARYADQKIGLTDASLLILAERYATDRILTLDHRHFRVLQTLDGDPFVLLPA
ncbi:MAG TPA: PIN domain-containing protein [Solirubrobacteraceae bacterium]|nr:PIN domain-containing protein [Solirubrobacteraceae bacterium]